MNVPHRPRVAVIAAAGAVLAATGWLAGGASGFVAAPMLACLCAVWLAALALPYLAGRRCAAQPAALADRCKPLGAVMAVTAVLLLAAGLMNLPAVRCECTSPESSMAASALCIVFGLTPASCARSLTEPSLLPGA